ncbi:MAG TPA: trypsin-like peptidase domain-containing protein [Candidatus Polarisedimenticolia bacterium]|nr:trypsin-like peptidase domain-containing protein [Candidatus Polarisedimenticolia bacterium]
MARTTARWSAVALSLVFLGGIVVAGPSGGRVVQVLPEEAQGGPTTEEMAAAQRGLHGWLQKELPQGAAGAIVRADLTAEDRRRMDAPQGPGPVPLRIGLAKRLPDPIVIDGLMPEDVARGGRVAGGILQPSGDGGFVWAVTIASSGAAKVRVHVDDVELPPSMDLFVYSAAGQAFGPYEGRGPQGTGEFWAHSIAGSEATVVLRQYGPPTADQLRQVSFVLDEIGHVIPRAAQDQIEQICGNPNCIVDATCVNDPIANPAKDATAKMEWISGAFIFTCTGGLVNDTDGGTQIPYFLTANHCLNRNRDAENVEFYWDFATSTCNGSCPNNNAFNPTLGSVVRATGSDGDFTLLEITGALPSGRVFLGFTNSPIANTNGALLYRISNPNFGPQVYSRHSVDTSAPTCSGWPRGESIYSRDLEGGTDGGSSGSPVLNASSQIVGQLSGGCGFNVSDPCDAEANATVDGALAHYWNSVSAFLDPDTGGGGCQPKGASCTVNSDCCSNSCKGPSGNKTCK